MLTWPSSKQDIYFLRLSPFLVDAVLLLFQLLIMLTVNQIARRRAAHLLKFPDAKIISLGIGDTTEPIPDVITNAMAEVPSRCEK